MVCSVTLTIPDLTEAKFWPVYGGRNWGRKESFKSSYFPKKSRLYTALPFCPACLPTKASKSLNWSLHQSMELEWVGLARTLQPQK
ncbi:hypothetical protein I79_011010 [Cricetulus griseus]|uniref:Uncharacterized protein n=1 Tax=Cricetulus griseus TaxID=10029 RepID=G3HK02_CRIGR|nr:hypothetical protein I79_011010 [Cricetulus griseus]